MIHPLKIARTYRRRWRLLRRMEIRPEDRVLEVGSGQNPNPRANVLCDRFLLDATERNEQPVRVDRPFVAGDIYALPFRDRAFDYVICSHVLEHLDRPEDAATELARVAPRGYIETPSRLNEKILSYPFHRWMVTEEEGTLRFVEKERPIWDEEINEWFREVGSRFPPLYDFFFDNLYDLGNVVSVVWEEEIDVEVERTSGRLSSSERFTRAGSREAAPIDGQVERIRRAFAADGASGWKGKVEAALSSLFRLRSDRRIDLESTLVCPECTGSLQSLESQLTCRSCGRSFPVLELADRRVPFLVAEDQADRDRTR